MPRRSGPWPPMRLPSAKHPAIQMRRFWRFCERRATTRCVAPSFAALPARTQQWWTTTPKIISAAPSAPPSAPRQFAERHATRGCRRPASAARAALSSLRTSSRTLKTTPRAYCALGKYSSERERVQQSLNAHFQDASLHCASPFFFGFCDDLVEHCPAQWKELSRVQARANPRHNTLDDLLFSLSVGSRAAPSHIARVSFRKQPKERRCRRAGFRDATTSFHLAQQRGNAAASSCQVEASAKARELCRLGRRQKRRWLARCVTHCGASFTHVFAFGKEIAEHQRRRFLFVVGSALPKKSNFQTCRVSCVLHMKLTLLSN